MPSEPHRVFINHHNMQFRKRVLAVAFASVAYGVAGQAMATYTVIDDDLLPTAVIEAREAQPSPATGEDFSIPFARKSASLGPMGRKEVDKALSMAPPGTSFRIVGRPDAQPSNVFTSDNSATTMPIGSARGEALRQYLLRQGIPADRITLAPDNSPNPQLFGGHYVSHIVIVKPYQDLPTNPAQRPAVTANLTPIRVSPAPAQKASVQKAPAEAAAFTQSTPTRNQERMVQFINEQVRLGAMDASVALTLLNTLLSGNAQPAPSGSRPSATASLPEPRPRPYRRALPTWTLDRAMTLRDNLDAWSRRAGWSPTQWDASNYFEVTSAFTLEGDFPDVLRQISDATGLNICADKRRHIVRVTDAGIRCDMPHN